MPNHLSVNTYVLEIATVSVAQEDPSLIADFTIFIVMVLRSDNQEHLSKTKKAKLKIACMMMFQTVLDAFF